ncbi:uncharacterized protein BDR25DRAFT_90994 [Lindgomyces ingoldianus]|uniref:Uncharacterized protein n=1 Tax=Lindgomyces ingoldianus TaxID=673940 RepID=A0ACB6RA01_9PLEO|nr:uncharacterized protein BDR25DRAFT_90994 [Lindgomyces ingoldianus]KAF2476149.1 hypothetical protein BDR25DRAFT_90994 [Lindgomyces ingoldianus]
MAAHVQFGQSLQQPTLQHAYAFNPVTPIHSPHHSLNSSTSSRTPLHTLTLHEYRKQQHTPTTQSATPPGKTLRRKAAAAALNEVERVPSVTRKPVGGSGSFRPLHLSQSAHELATHHTLPPSPPHFFQQSALQDRTFRSQSAELRDPGGTAFGYPTFSQNQPTTVSNWKPIKRLPKPPPRLSPIPSPVRLNSQSHLVSPVFDSALLSSGAHPSVFGGNPLSSGENLGSSGGQTTSSTFSLSRFPQPPHLVDPSLSPPNDENAPPRLNISFTTTAPETPPATPAILHYRGTSFDLVNPHESLLLHDIETPTRDTDSPDYFPLRSSEDPLMYSEMAAPRKLFSDLKSAHRGVTRRADESSGASDNNLPREPEPVALSPPSQYSSPEYSYDLNMAVSPLAPKRSAGDSRFSLKQLTRNLTRKIVKTPEEPFQQELQEFTSSHVSLADNNLEGTFPRPLDESYPIRPDSLSATNRLSGLEGAIEEEPPVRRISDLRYSSAPLTSMVPDDPSSQAGRAENPRISLSEGDMGVSPYYEDIESLYHYQSSSIYTRDDGDASGYPPSLSSKRMSNPFGPLTYQDDDLSSNYNRQSTYSYSNAARFSRRASRPLTSQIQSNEKTDTISKFIDHYGHQDHTESSIPTLSSPPFEGYGGIERPQPARMTSGLSQFDFELRRNDSSSSNVSPIQTVPGRRRFQQHSPPPLASPFEYDEMPEPFHRQDASEMFTGASSYGDTRHLLQLSQPSATEVSGHLSVPQSPPTVPGQALEPSSSYSQPEGPNSPQTPQEALDHAEQIFAEGSGNEAIPAIWARCSSGNLASRNQHNFGDNGPVQDMLANMGEFNEEEKEDWETVGNNSKVERPSMDDSIADYSSSDDASRAGLSVIEDASLPGLEGQAYEQDLSLYEDPSPRPTHRHPFNASPPPLLARASVRTVPDHVNNTPRESFAQSSTTMPLFHNQDNTIGAPYYCTPWRQYDLSDKETLELLNSGPNEEIIYNDEEHELQELTPGRSIRAEPPSASTLGNPIDAGFERENTFEKLTVLGPKGNLTGTPRGTGMREAGSSVADLSSPGAALSSTPYGFYATPGRSSSNTRIRPPNLPEPRSSSQHQRAPSGTTRNNPYNFYDSPGATASFTRIQRSNPAEAGSPSEHERSPSQCTLFPSHYRLKANSPEHPSPLSGKKRNIGEIAAHRYSIKPPSPNRRRGHNRPAVHGQTKLREMILASDTMTLSSGHSTHMSRFMGVAGSERPTSANTESPLRGLGSQATIRTVFADPNSPRLYQVERGYCPEIEAERRKKSWILFAMFCLFPPALILFRFFGDWCVTTVTNGDIGYCTPRSKQAATYAGVAINIGIIAAILIPILVGIATGSL